MRTKKSGDIYNAQRWGLPPEAVAGLGERLSNKWDQLELFQNQDQGQCQTRLDLPARPSGNADEA